MTQTERNFRKLIVAYEKVKDTQCDMDEKEFNDHMKRLANLFKNFMTTHIVFNLSKRNIARLMDVQMSHQPMQSYEFIACCVRDNKYIKDDAI